MASEPQARLLSIQDIQAAQRRIAEGLWLSPCTASIPLSEVAGCHIYCKLEYLQRTGSFKERGARNALLQLDRMQRFRGVIAASAGNHALGLAYHGKLLGVPVTVVMPAYAPLIKVTTCRQLGARVILHGEDFSEAMEHARALAEPQGLRYIHGYDDPAIIAGQGTLGLEIMQQTPQVDAVLVPIGGGGLIAGVALAIKSLRPTVQVIGVTAAHAPAFSVAWQGGRPIPVTPRATLADGLAVGQVGELSFALARPRVDRIVTVTEDELALAVLRLLELEKSVVEGAGAAPLAACLGGHLPELTGQHVVLVLSGGNIDPAVLGRVIDRGMVADGRLCRFTAAISDRPGGLARFAALIASTGASIREVAHDRAFSGADVSAVNVICTVETSDRGHIQRLYAALRKAAVRFTGFTAAGDDPSPAGERDGPISSA